MDQEEWEEAIRLLEHFLTSHPDHVEALNMLAYAYQELEHFPKLWEVIVERLLPLQPDDPDIWLNAVMACMANNLPFYTRYHAAHFLENWPDHPKASEIRELYRNVEAFCAGVESGESLDPGVTSEGLLMFEQAQVLLNCGNFLRSRQVSQEAVRRLPGAAAPLNNLSLSYALEGRFEDAIRFARQVLEKHPDNIHALANLTEYLVRVGQREEAEGIARHLRTQTPRDGVMWIKQLEAFSHLGDDQAVSEIHQEMERAGLPEDEPLAMAHHLGAVAFARLGDLKRAKQLWKGALRHDPKMSLARENLADLKNPPGKRSGAWPFSLQQWVPLKWVEALLDAARAGERSQAASQRNLRRVLREIPGIEALLPILLERGDPIGRDFALLVASQMGLPILRDFALSDNGTDESRMEAAQQAIEAGLLPRGKPVSVFTQGEQRELLLMAYEIYTQAGPRSMPQRVRQFADRSYEAFNDQRYEEAERLAREGLEAVPDQPTLLNYLAGALKLQGRIDEANEIIRHTAERHPDYLFARCQMAQLCVEEGKLDEARAWIDPLLELPRFHVSEFAALCLAQAELLAAEGLMDGARSWLGMLEQADPDNRNLPLLRRRLKGRRSKPSA